MKAIVLNEINRTPATATVPFFLLMEKFASSTERAKPTGVMPAQCLSLSASVSPLRAWHMSELTRFSSLTKSTGEMSAGRGSTGTAAAAGRGGTKLLEPSSERRLELLRGRLLKHSLGWEPAGLAELGLKVTVLRLGLVTRVEGHCRAISRSLARLSVVRKFALLSKIAFTTSPMAA